MARITRDFDGVRVVTDDWPVVLIEFPETRRPDSAFQDSLLYLEALFKDATERKETTFTITDLTRLVEFPSKGQRTFAAEWLARSLPLQKAASLGGAIVVRSTMLRGFINTVHWFARPAMPSIFVATRRDAFAEAVKAFDAARVPLRAEIRAALAKR